MDKWEKLKEYLDERTLSFSKRISRSRKLKSHNHNILTIREIARIRKKMNNLE